MRINRSITLMTALFLVSCGIGLYKIAAFECISRDGTLFLNFAEDLSAAPGNAIRSYDQHPGYPAMILASHRILDSLHGPLSLDERIISAQAVTLLCRSLTACVLYLIFLQFSGPVPAFVNALVLLLIPAYAENGSDVLSDWPALLSMSLAGLFSLLGIRQWKPLFFLAVGAVSGLGYYIRPEAIVFLPILFLFAAVQMVFFSPSGKRIGAALGIMTCTAIGIVLPYMLYKGAVFPKKDIGQFANLEFSSTSAAAPAVSAAFYHLPPGSVAAISTPARGVFHFFEEAANTLFLFLIPWILIVLYKAVHFRTISDPDRLLTLLAAGWFLLLIWLFCHAGYISYRHLLPLIAFSFTWLYEGIAGVVNFIVRNPRRAQQGIMVFLAVGTVLFIPKLLRPVRLEKAIYREAGAWLYANTRPGDRLCVFDPRIGFYAGRRYSPLVPASMESCDYLVAESDFRPTGPALTPLKTGLERIDTQLALFRLHRRP